MFEESDLLKGVLRAKVFFWLASQPAISILMSLAGRQFSCKKAGVWWASVPSEKRPPEPNKEFYDWLLKIWDENYGDRRNELVFIGWNYDEQVILKALNEAQLTKAETSKPQNWKNFVDPFPE